MLKAEFFKTLKQTSVSVDVEKTKERLREIWSPLAKPKRNEILALSGLKKFSIERAYKSGNVSAKIVVAMVRVLGTDPYYLIGKSDEQHPVDDAVLMKFLAELKYNISKRDFIKHRIVNPINDMSSPPETSAEVSIYNEGTDVNYGDNTDASTADEAPAVHIPAVPSATCTNPATTPFNLSTIATEIAKLDKESLSQLNGLTEDALILMLKSLTVQADFNESKRERLILIKYLLLS